MIKKKIEKKPIINIIKKEVFNTSFLLGQIILLNSPLTSLYNFKICKFIFLFYYWQEWWESNPQPPVLETDTLPIELHSYVNYYAIILVTEPAPTVLPPSRMANRNDSSIAIGAVNVMCNFTLSPGITIAIPSGNFTSPVISVVLK